MTFELTVWQKWENNKIIKPLEVLWKSEAGLKSEKTVNAQEACCKNVCSLRLKNLYSKDIL